MASITGGPKHSSKSILALATWRKNLEMIEVFAGQFNLPALYSVCLGGKLNVAFRRDSLPKCLCRIFTWRQWLPKTEFWVHRDFEPVMGKCVILLRKST